MSGGAADHTCLHTDLKKVSESQVDGRRRKLVSLQTRGVLVRWRRTGSDDLTMRLNQIIIC